MAAGVKPVTPLNRRARGSDGEQLACEYLALQGLHVVERNFRSHRGEIDIVAREGEYLVFCEVKCRESDEFGSPEHAVTAEKARQVRNVAEGYLAKNGIREQACRFDVVAIRFSGARGVLNHIRNAF
jgi:putative endonuclease